MKLAVTRLLRAIIATGQVHFNRLEVNPVIRRLFAFTLLTCLGLAGVSLLTATAKPPKAGEIKDARPSPHANLEKQPKSVSESLASGAGALSSVAVKNLSPNFVDQNLDEALKWCAAQLGLQVFIDRPALKDEGIELDQKVTLQLKEVAAESVLELILEPLQLEYTLRDQRVLFITTRQKLSERLETRIFDVADLVLHDVDDGSERADFTQLIELVTSTIEPESWDEVGGPGSVREFNARDIHVLVVRQTDRNHLRITRLLTVLRSFRHEPVETRRLESPRPATSRKESLPPTGDVASQITNGDGIAHDNNQFAVDLYSRLRNSSEKNLLFSPYSISSALAMTYAGAGGETASEMAQTLHFTRPPGELHVAFAALRESLEQSGKQSGFELRIANRLWGQEGHTFHAPFLTTTREQYGAELVRLQFAQPVVAAETINSWIDHQTVGRIKDLIGPADIDVATRLVLTNAVYFKGQWKDRFTAALTLPAPFDTWREKHAVRMMQQEETCLYLANDELQIIDKPYQGGNCSMMVLLPTKRGNKALSELENGLTAAAIEGWVARLKRRTVQIHLPRFTFESSFVLNEPLSAMGMTKCFDFRVADFSGMSSSAGIELSKVIHKAFVAVDEEGTEAAAATAVFGGFGGATPAPTLPVFRADRPFLFLIRDRKTGVILFLGRVVDPRAKS